MSEKLTHEKDIQPGVPETPKKTRNRKPKEQDYHALYTAVNKLPLDQRVKFIRDLRNEVKAEVDDAKFKAEEDAKLLEGI